MNRKILTRTMIIQVISKALNPLDYVHALYEGGAAAFNRLDEWSDIDLYVLVDDRKAKKTFEEVEKALKSLSAIAQKLDLPQTQWKNVSQAFYRLEDASEYLIIDLAVLETSSVEKFLEPAVHGKAVFHINRDDRITIPQLNAHLFAVKITKRIERLKARFGMFNNFVQKEINRGNFIEALDLYYNLTLASLVEALRIKHYPVHYDFRTRYLHRELPRIIVKKLQCLCFISNKKDLQEKYALATAWFQETITKIDNKETERQLQALCKP